MSDPFSEPTIAEIAAAVSRLADESYRRLQVDLFENLYPEPRHGGGATPNEPTVGWTPFTVATLIASGAVDWAAIASGIISTAGGAPHIGTAGSAGSANSLNRSDHAHPAQLSLFVGAAGSGNFLARHGLAADANGRLSIGLDTSDRAYISVGPGGAGARDWRLVRTGTAEVTIDDGTGAPATTKHVGPLFVQGPNSMDLAITYAAPGQPNGVTRTDGALISTTVINYTGAQVASVVTTRFGKTITVTPTYTGPDITSVHRAVA